MVIGGVGCDSWGCHERSTTDRSPSGWALDQVGGPGFLDRGVRGRRPAGRQAEQRPAERLVGLAAQQRRVHPGRGAGQAVRAQRRSRPWWSTSVPTAVTPADQAKAAADVQRFAGVQDVTGKVLGPVPSQDGRALQVVVPVRVEEEATAGRSLPHGSRRCARSPRPTPGARGVCDRAGWVLRRLRKVFSGFDARLLYITAAIVIVILLLTYKPGAVAAPVDDRVRRPHGRAGGHLPAGTGCGLTVNAQTAFILTVLVLWGRDRLCVVADRPLPGGAATPRRPPRGHGGGAGSGGPGDHRQRRHRDLEPLTLLVAELNSTKSLGPVMAIGVAVGLLAMITLLPALLVIFGRWVFWPRRPTVGSAEPTKPGPGSASAWPPAPAGLDRHRGGAGRAGARRDPAGRERPRARTPSAPSPRRWRARRRWPATSRPVRATPVQVIGNAEAAPQLQAVVAATG